MAEQIGSQRFLHLYSYSYELLSKIQHVSKLMQSPSMQIDVAGDLLRKVRDALMSYIHCKKTMWNEMNTEAELKQKQLRSEKRHFGNVSQDEPIKDVP